MSDAKPTVTLLEQLSGARQIHLDLLYRSQSVLLRYQTMRLVLVFVIAMLLLESDLTRPPHREIQRELEKWEQEHPVEQGFYDHRYAVFLDEHATLRKELLAEIRAWIEAEEIAQDEKIPSVHQRRVRKHGLDYLALEAEDVLAQLASRLEEFPTKADVEEAQLRARRVSRTGMDATLESHDVSMLLQMLSQHPLLMQTYDGLPRDATMENFLSIVRERESVVRREFEREINIWRKIGDAYTSGRSIGLSRLPDITVAELSIDDTEAAQGWKGIIGGIVELVEIDKIKGELPNAPNVVILENNQYGSVRGALGQVKTYLEVREERYRKAKRTTLFGMEFAIPVSLLLASLPLLLAASTLYPALVRRELHRRAITIGNIHGRIERSLGAMQHTGEPAVHLGTLVDRLPASERFEAVLSTLTLSLGGYAVYRWIRVAFVDSPEEHPERLIVALVSSTMIAITAWMSLMTVVDRSRRASARGSSENVNKGGV